MQITSGRSSFMAIFGSFVFIRALHRVLKEARGPRSKDFLGCLLRDPNFVLVAAPDYACRP